ncbi:protein CASC1-like [Phthorimaea operculella]|nr:protein CASC1-like [Phthorimaea operculella]
MGAKKKKKKDPVANLVPIYMEPPPPEEEEEPVEYTDTSYTSASWEDVPPLPVVEGKEEEEVVADDIQAWSEESFPDNEFEKPKNWKKLNRKQQEAWMAERIEQWRAEVEAEKQARLADVKEKRKREAAERAALVQRDNAEMEIRRDILQKTCRLMGKFETQKKNYDLRKQMKAEWAQYLQCDGLPDPRVVTQMATYLHVWKERALYDDNELDKKCSEVLPMLEMLEEFVANARNYTEQQAINYNECRLQLREQLSVAIEFASYAVLRNLEEKMKWHSIKLCTYQRVFQGLKMNLWVAVKMPTMRPRPVKDIDSLPPPTELEFPGIKVTVTLPNVVDSSCICVRASRSMIDFLSESSRTFAMKQDLPDKYIDFFVFNVKEHVEVYKKKDEQDAYRKAFFRALRERTRELEKLIASNIYAKLDKEKEELEILMLAEPPEPLPDPRTWLGEEREKAFRAFLKTNNLRVRSGEVNLRKYKICGGVLYLDLLITPPQSKRMEYGINITTCKYIQYCRLDRPYLTAVKPIQEDHHHHRPALIPTYLGYKKICQ